MNGIEVALLYLLCNFSFALHTKTINTLKFPPSIFAHINQIFDSINNFLFGLKWTLKFDGGQKKQQQGDIMGKRVKSMWWVEPWKLECAISATPYLTLYKTEKNFLRFCSHCIVHSEKVLCTIEFYWNEAHKECNDKNEKKTRANSPTYRTRKEIGKQSKKFCRWNLCGAMRNICFFTPITFWIHNVCNEYWTICFENRFNNMEQNKNNEWIKRTR